MYDTKPVEMVSTKDDDYYYTTDMIFFDMVSKWHNNSQKRKKKEKGAPQWGDIEKGVKTSIRYWCVYTWKKVKNVRKNSQKRGEGEEKKGEKRK